MPATFRICEYEEEPSFSSSTSAPGSTNTSPFREFLVSSSSSSCNDDDGGDSRLLGSGTYAAVIHIEELSSSAKRWFQTPFTVAKELFLPIGFPSSVKEGYLEYQLYDSLQGLCSYLRGVLCSAQVLQAAGVGNQNATALAVAFTWALKDGMGMIGGLGFSYLASPLFDAHVKEFRLFADLINDVGLTLDMLAPYAGSENLLAVTSAATLCKTLCGMSAAATKASITQYFAIAGNMADLNAKESTQETLVSLLGMMMGASLASHLQQYEEHHKEFSQSIQWTIFLFLTAVHVWANWMGVCLLRLETLNQARADLVFDNLFEEDGTKFKSSLSNVSFVSPNDINESLIVSSRKMFWPGRLRLGASLVLMLQQISDLNVINKVLDDVSSEKYIVTIHKGIVYVCLLRGATNEDEIKAYCHARILAKLLGMRNNDDESSNHETVRQAAKDVNKLFQSQQEENGSILNLLKVQGWDVDGRLYLGFPRKRTELLTSKKD